MFAQIIDTPAACDLCGAKPDDGKLYCDEKRLCVCAGCKRKLEEMPKGIRENLENYLIGNVI